MNKEEWFLFSICSLIWGTTWYVILFQIDATTPTVAVFYRYLLAAVIMFGINILFLKRSLIFPIKNHLYFLGLGFFNFCLNYNLTYNAEKYINTGLVALTFTSLIYFNMLGMKLFFKKPIRGQVFWGAVIGFIGIACLFKKEIFESSFTSTTTIGVVIGLLATLSASIGNMFGTKNYSFKIPVLTYNAFGMLYGALFTLGYGLLTQEDFTLPLTTPFLSSLLYLSIFGTVIAFWSYQTLSGKIGPEKAAYTSLVSPVIAVIISHLYEGITFNFFLVIGMILCLLGNYIALKK
jgi:drug/metabolite transporter (DMT)-like permease